MVPKDGLIKTDTSFLVLTSSAAPDASIAFSWTRDHLRVGNLPQGRFSFIAQTYQCQTFIRLEL